MTYFQSFAGTFSANGHSHSINNLSFSTSTTFGLANTVFGNVNLPGQYTLKLNGDVFSANSLTLQPGSTVSGFGILIGPATNSGGTMAIATAPTGAVNAGGANLRNLEATIYSLGTPTIGSIQSEGGTLTSTTGGMILTGGVTHTTGVFAGSQTTNLNLDLNLGGAARTFGVAQDGGAVDLRVSGGISNGAVTKTGGGAMELTGANAYEGATTINQGALRVSSADNLQHTSGIAISNGASLTSTATHTNNRPLTITSSGNLISESGTVTYVGGVALAGNLAVGGAGNTTIGGSGISSSGTRSLTKSGIGTLTLSTNNSYSGATSISGGTVLANASVASTGTGTVTVGSTGTLGGTGRVFGSVNVQSGGRIAPGASIESLEVGALTFQTGSNYQYEFDSSASVLDEAADLLAVNGMLTILAGTSLSMVDLANSPAALSAGSKLTVIRYLENGWNGGTFIGLSNLSTFNLGPNTFSINYADTMEGDNFATGLPGRFVTLTVVAVPEASALLLFGAVACAAGAFRAWRRRAGQGTRFAKAGLRGAAKPHADVVPHVGSGD